MKIKQNIVFKLIQKELLNVFGTRRPVQFLAYFASPVECTAEIKTMFFLLQAHFDDVYNYKTYQWAVPAGETKGSKGCTVKIQSRYIPEPGWYCLCYVSSQLNCILGMSEPFQVQVKSICGK